MTAKLFSAGRIGPLVLPNRIVMTAMGIAQSAPDGRVTDAEVAFYRERARGGVGLIITECMVIDWATGRGNLHQTAACDDAHIAGLTRLATSIHEAGGKIVAQIYHPGRQGFTHVNGTESQPAPSDVPDAMTQQPVHAMSLAEIATLVDMFEEAAQRLQAAGFDGVEIHAAHGYLLNSFLSPYANFRSDEYGGSTEGRARIVCEIIERVRQTCGDDFAIIVRISADEYLEMAGKPGEGITIEEGVAIAKLLEAAGSDALDVSSGIYETMNTAWEPFAYEEGWKSHLAERVKAAVSVPVIGVSVYRNPAFAERLLVEDRLDFVGSARAHFADPYWSMQAQAALASARTGEKSDSADSSGVSDGVREKGSDASAMSLAGFAARRCISCLACMETLIAADEGAGPARCAINPRTARELVELPKNGERRLVVVAGAGPAGLEAAVTAAERGFAVILFEKEARIGGQLNLASQPPGKNKINWMLEYYDNRIKALGIDLRLSTAVTPEALAGIVTGEQLEAYENASVIVAVGSEPILPGAIPGLDGANVYVPPAVLNGSVNLAGKEVVVIGSGMTGIETTEFLAEQGCKLSLFEMLPDIGPGVYFQNMMDIMPKLASHNVQFYPAHKLLGIIDGKALFENMAATSNNMDAERQSGVVSDPKSNKASESCETNSRLEVSAEAFVVSLGTRPLTVFAQAVQALIPSAVVIGDSSKPGRIMDATLSGWEAARSL
ncbi:MAG: NAD(P)/FAD-dependent oxidoreductase [Coriobacteriales bacterium]|jgi:2,4-dienoyl-CoA reductase-like NADH-dependent reductase (Old Yellow Enzyme family)/NADPH-dependent 2,4-dienoyl-CoA reductase/sulfur reductase-like enzyme|nr:NAD(P)/FAD-dependent oxidoreductase [Coriobacteriales bacterium]